MRKIRNPRYAPESLEPKLYPSSLGLVAAVQVGATVGDAFTVDMSLDESGSTGEVDDLPPPPYDPPYPPPPLDPYEPPPEPPFDPLGPIPPESPSF